MKGVAIRSDGTAMGTTITADGAEVRGVRAVRFVHDAGERPAAELDLCLANIDAADLSVRVMVADPASGEMKQVSRIAFADGTEWTA